MARRTAGDYSPEIMQLFDRFVHGDISRREFIDHAAAFTVGAGSAAAVLESLCPDFAAGQQVAADDARLRSEFVDFASPQGAGTLRGYLVRGVDGLRRRPGVVVIHENRGLNPHIEDIARRIALDGYIAFAPDALTPLGGYPGNEDDARALFAQLDRDRLPEDYDAYLYEGANHGFNNDTTPRFDEDSAARAWRRTMSFFARHLGT